MRDLLDAEPEAPSIETEGGASRRRWVAPQAKRRTRSGPTLRGGYVDFKSPECRFHIMCAYAELKTLFTCRWPVGFGRVPATVAEFRLPEPFLLRHACNTHPQHGRLKRTQGSMRNSFEALCTLADRERWCWKIHCGTCGHGDFRYGLSALSSGGHPDSADWIVRRGAGAEIEARMGPMPSFESWPIRQQRQLQKIIGDADIQGIAEACSFPDWVGYLGLALHYTEEAEREKPVISRGVARRLGQLVIPGSPAQTLLRSRAAAEGDERLTWEDLGSVSDNLLRELRVPRRSE
jgi:hypothetical protein